MKRKSLLFALLAALFMPWAANAQVSIPYTEGFENMSSASDLTAAGWISYNSQSGSVLKIETSASNVHTGSKALNMDSWDASSSAAILIAGLPTVNATINTLQITFSYKVSTGTVDIGYLTDVNDASTFVSLQSFGNSSSYTTKTVELNEAPSTAARIAIKYTNYYRCYVDDIEVKALPTCVKPTLGQAQYITEEGASFQWTENGSATNWVLEYSTDQNFTNATSINRSGIPNYAITGLTAGTLYYVHVKSNCGGGDESDWSNTVSFTTLCEPINAEGYSENFDSYTGSSSASTNNLPDCWNHINTCSYSYYSGYPIIYNSNASSSPNCLRFYSYYSSYGSYDPQPQYAILPPMNGLAGMQVTLKAKGYNATSTFKIGTMSDPSDASSFTMITEQTGLTTSYQEFEYVVPANCRDKCLAIMIEAATTSTAIGVYIDDIVIATPPTCIKPSGLEVTATTTTTATLSWTNGAEGQTAWQICLNGDETNLIAANSNPFTIEEGLSAASTYTAKVRANCGNGDYSDWSNTVTIETPCDVITVTESWSENFNNLTAGIPNCWDNSEGTTTTASNKWNYYATGHEGVGLRFNSYSNSNGNTNFLKTPTLNFATGKVMQLNFWYKNPTGGDFSVYISTDGGNTYTTALVTGLTGASSWTQQEINLTNYVDAPNVVIVFKGTSNYGNGDAYIYLDDVAIVEAPSCLKPTGLAVTANSITYDGAVITWTAGASETEWQIEFATDASFTNPLYETVEDEPTYTFHGLTDGTTYFVHVQAVCGGSNGSSEYSEPVSFSTLQTPANLPYATDFENGNDWLFVNGGLTNAWAYGTATSNGEGTHALYISNDGGTTNAYTISSAAMVYATKLFNFEDGIYVFSYDWKTYGEGYSDYLRVALVPSSVQLAAATSVPSGFSYNGLPTGWIALDGGGKLNLQTEWQSFTSDEMEVAAGSYMMVFAWRDDTSVGTTPPAAIDNVSIEKITCTTPTDLDAPDSGITATSAQLIWTETGEATAWEIELTDEDENTSTIDVAEADLVEGVFTIEDLTSETMYSVRVRANCGGTDGNSDWSSPVSFTTGVACPAPTNVAANQVTNNSAMINWEGNASTYNVQYREYVPSTEILYDFEDGMGNWTTIDADGDGYNWVLGSAAEVYTYEGNLSGEGYNHSNDLIVSGSYRNTNDEDGTPLTPDNYLVSPMINLGGTISFYAHGSNSDYVAEHFGVFVSTGSNNDPDDFVMVNEWTATTTSYIQYSADLSAYSGQGYVAIRHFNCTDQFLLSVDNITITEPAQGGNWTVVEDVTSPTTITNLNAEATYQVKVQANCGSEDGTSAWVGTTFTTLSNCSAPNELYVTELTNNSAKLNWTGAQTSYNVRFRELTPGETTTTTEDFEHSGSMPTGWTMLDLGDGDNTAELGVFEIAAQNGTYGFRFSSYDGSSSGSFDQYLISPELDNLSALSFAFKSSNGTYDKFRIGYSTTTNDVSAFTWGEENNSASTWTTYTEDVENIPANAKYFAINYTAVYAYRLYIDNITYTYTPMTAGAWNTDNTNVNSELTINNLAQNTKYEWQVQGINSSCDGDGEGHTGVTEWSEMASFTTFAKFTKTIAAVDATVWAEGKGGYYLIASPLAADVDPTTITGMTTGDYDLYAFNQDEDLEWRNYKASSFDLVNGQGYLYANKEGVTLTFTGVPYSGNGEVTLSMTDDNTVDFQGWNLVGNPFGEDAYITKDFYTLENSDTYTENTAGTAINAMQGLLVIADNNNETLTFSTTAPTKKAAKLNMNVSKDRGVVDHAIISFSEGHQLPKLQFRQNSTKVYLPKEGKDYAIVSTESNVGEIPVSFKAEKNGSYTLSFTSEEVTFSYLHLIDNMTGNDVNLLETPSYTFDARTSDYESRFRLVFATGTSVDDNTFGFVNAMGNFCIFGIEGEATVQVIDMLGHVISSETFSGSYERKINGAPGVYMVRLINGNEVRTQKVVVR